MPDYKMVAVQYSSEDVFMPLDFNRQVRDLLQEGYELYGPPMTTKTKSAIGNPLIVFSQALYKP